MRKWIALPAALVMVLALGALADDAAVKKQLDSELTEMMAAFKKGDAKACMSIMADDYVGIGPQGEKVDKAAATAMMKKYMTDTKKINSSKFTIADLKVKGNSATCISTFNLDAVVVDNDGMMGEKGKTHRMQMVELTNVTWTKKGSKWLISKESPAGPPKMMVDGKPFNPGPPPAPKTKKG